jgi:uracil-DNA glycosylase
VRSPGRIAAEFAERGGLEELLLDIAACRICRDAPRFAAPPPHEPRPVLQAAAGARILIASQAPGTRVHASGKPYADRSGDRLRHWLGMSEAEFYDPERVAIVPMGLCFPGLGAAGADLPPRRECAPTWHEPLLRQLNNIALVLAVGRFAQIYHFERLGLRGWLAPSLDATMQHWEKIWKARKNPSVMPLPHPSWHNNRWLNRNPWFEAELLPELRRELRWLL